MIKSNPFEFVLNKKSFRIWLRKEVATAVITDGFLIITFKDGESTDNWHKYLHREDGHAVEHPDGSKSWYINGEHHREDGPAIEFASNYSIWFWHGEKIDVNSQEEFEIWKRFKNFQ